MHRAVGRVHRHGCERGGERERHREAVRVIHRAGSTGEPQVTAGAVSTGRGPWSGPGFTQNNDTGRNPWGASVTHTYKRMISYVSLLLFSP